MKAVSTYYNRNHNEITKKKDIQDFGVRHENLSETNP